MKINWNKMFSVSVAEEEYFNDSSDKITFTGCKLSGEKCLDYLPKINDYFRESEQFIRVKDYNRAIDALAYAYRVAEEIEAPECRKCAMFFKATVVQSLTNIHSELEKMSRGLFPTKRYHASFIKAEELLRQITVSKEVRPEFRAKKETVLQPVYSF